MSTDPANPSDDDLAMVDFLRQWYTHGGGRAEDMMIRFGLSPQDYFARVKVLLENGAGRSDRSAVAGMLAVCRKRLWLGQ